MQCIVSSKTWSRIIGNVIVIWHLSLDEPLKNRKRNKSDFFVLIQLKLCRLESFDLKASRKVFTISDKVTLKIFREELRMTNDQQLDYPRNEIWFRTNHQPQTGANYTSRIRFLANLTDTAILSTTSTSNRGGQKMFLF